MDNAIFPPRATTTRRHGTFGASTPCMIEEQIDPLAPCQPQKAIAAARMSPGRNLVPKRPVAGASPRGPGAPYSTVTLFARFRG
jgi:hypothetical protein